MTFWRLIKRAVGGDKAPRAKAQALTTSQLAPVTVAVVSPGDLEKPGQPIYPPVDAGIRVRPGNDLIAAQHELIKRLRQHVSHTPKDFESKYLEPIRRLADFVGLLPASDNRHHSGAGGLFAYALQMGVMAARSADGMLFAASESPERRRDVEAAWRHATFLAALSCDLYKPLNEMTVVTPSGDTWAPYLGGLTQWAQSKHADRVYVRWLGTQRPANIPSSRGTTAWALNAIAGESLLSSLHNVRPEIVTTMAAIVTGTMGSLSDHPMVRALNIARKGVLELDEAINPRLYGKLTQGAHLEPLLIDGMRQLVATHRWEVNKGKSVLQFGADGLFIVWPAGAKNLQDDMEQRGVKGVPSNAASLADLLLAGGIVAKAPDGTPYHMIRCADSKDQEKGKLVALRLVRSDSLLAGLEGGPEPKPVEQKLLIPVEGVAPGTTQASPPTGTAETAPASKPSEAKAPASKAPKADTPPAPEPLAPPAPIAQLTPGFTPPPRGNASVPAASPTPTPSTATAEPPKEGGDAAASPSVPQVQAAPPSDKKKDDGASPPDGIPADVVVCLGVPLARTIARFRDDYNASRSQSDIGQVESGIAITVSYALENSGLTPARFQEPLKENGFLVLTESAEGRVRRPLHMVTLKGTEARAYILTKKFASRCGFVIT